VSGRANYKKFNLKLFYNLLFSGQIKTCIAPAAMEVKEISKMF